MIKLNKKILLFAFLLLLFLSPTFLSKGSGTEEETDCISCNCCCIDDIHDHYGLIINSEEEYLNETGKLGTRIEIENEFVQTFDPMDIKMYGPEQTSVIGVTMYFEQPILNQGWMQSFVATEPYIDKITLWLERQKDYWPRPYGYIRVYLHDNWNDADNRQNPIRTASLYTSVFSQYSGGWFEFSFSKLPLTIGKRYYFRVHFSGDTPGVVIGTKENAYATGKCYDRLCTFPACLWWYWREYGTGLTTKRSLAFRISYENKAPYTPTIITPSTLEVCKELTFRTKAVDPEGNDVRYRFSFNDGTTWTPWSAKMSHNTEYSKTATFYTTGTHYIKVQVQDRVKNNWYGVEYWGSVTERRMSIYIDGVAPIGTWSGTSIPQKINLNSWQIKCNEKIKFQLNVKNGMTCIEDTVTARLKIQNREDFTYTYITDWASPKDPGVGGAVFTFEIEKDAFNFLINDDSDVFRIYAEMKSVSSGKISSIYRSISISPNTPSISTGSATAYTTSATISGSLSCDGGLRSYCDLVYKKYGDGGYIPVSGGFAPGFVPPAFNYNGYLSSLQPTTDYLYMARVTSYTSDLSTVVYVVLGNEEWFFTPPGNPDYLTATSIGNAQVHLTWGIPSTAQGSRVQYKYESGSWKSVPGGEIHETSTTTLIHTTTDGPGTYYYRVYSIAYSFYMGNWRTSGSAATDSVEIYAPPTVVSLKPVVQEYEFKIRGRIDDTGVGGGCCKAFFAYGMDNSTPYSTTEKNICTNGQEYSNDIYQLGISGPMVQPGVLYFYKAGAWNAGGFGMTYGDMIILMTKPLAVINPYITFIPEDMPPPIADNLKSSISWTNEDGGEGAYIEWVTGTPPSPWSPGDGNKLNDIDYYDGEEAVHFEMAANKTYYYKIWSCGKSTIFIDDEWKTYTSNGTEAFPFGNAKTINFTTPQRPEPPQNLFFPMYGKYEVYLTWDKGNRSDITKIMADNLMYPQDWQSGRFVYEEHGDNAVDYQFGDYSVQHYRAWSYNETYKLWSDGYDEKNTSVIDFQLFFPTYLEVGEYIISWGKIVSLGGQAVEGFITSTFVQDLYGNRMCDPVYWNCIDGNYQTTISTTEFRAGTYEIVSEFTNMEGTTYIFAYVHKLYLSKEGEELESYYTRANIHYTFYNVETGIGLDDNYYKVYISEDTDFSPGDRVKGGVLGIIRSDGKDIYTGKRYYIQVRDFNGNIIPIGEYSDNLKGYRDGLIQNAYAGFNVSQPEVYVDLGIYLNNFRIKNMNESTVYIILTRVDGLAGQVVGRFIPPLGETQLSIPDGVYNLTIEYYYNDRPEIGPFYRDFPLIEDMRIETDLFYYIRGYNLDDICHKIIGEGTFVYYTIFDMNTGSLLGDDFYKVYFSEDTTFDENDRFKGGEYKTDLYKRIYFKIEDYWGNLVHPIDGSSFEELLIESTTTFLDIGIPLNQLLISNQNESIVYLRITNGPDFSECNTWYNRWIPPGESTELFIRSGTYNISMEFYYPHNATLISFKNITNFTLLSDTMLNILGKNSIIYFNIFDANTGIAAAYKNLKIYVDGVRINSKYISTRIGDEIRIEIKDYFENILYNGTVTSTKSITYVDIPLIMYSLKFSNYKNEYFATSVRKNNSVIWIDKIMTPYSAVEYMLTPGDYTVKLYNQSLFFSEINLTINKSTAYTIMGDDINKSLTHVLDGQNLSINMTFKDMLESYNLTNIMLSDLLGYIPYRNQTITSLLEEFRKPHTLVVPVMKEKYEDKLAPNSQITATTSIDGTIEVKWFSTDNMEFGLDYVTLYYKMENASWKEWHTNLTASGKKNFNGSEESLVLGKNYSFRALGMDKSENLEEPSSINTITINYKLIEIKDEPLNFVNILQEVVMDMTFILILIAIIICFIILILIERRKNKQDEKEEMNFRGYYE